MTPRTSAPASDNQGQTQSLEARVGQLFVVLLDPNRPPHQAVRWHGEHYFGGFFLRSENMPTIGQTRALSRLFRGYGRGFPPAMIAIDEEGGLVSHTSKITTSAPSAMALGVVDDADVTGDVYEGIGTKLRSLGVNTVFAPVADIHSEPANPVIGTRAFGTTARSVTKHAGAAIKGLRRAGVASTLKHFPGHGGTTQDSHFTLPTVDGSKDQLTDRELSPFISLIEDEKPELVMAGHVAYPGLDSSGKPASLSRPILTDLLRSELDFKGLIITDSLDMEAVKKDGPEVAVQALEAGCDLLLFGQDLEFAVQCYQVVLEAFRSKKLSEERLVESLERIHKLRDSFRARTWIRNEDAYDNLQITEEALFFEAAQKGLEIEGNAGVLRAIPKALGKRLCLLPAQLSQSWLPDLLPMVKEQLEPAGFEVHSISEDPSADEVEEARRMASDAEVIVLATFSRGATKGSVKSLIEAVSGRDVMKVGIALGNPRDAESMMAMNCRIKTHGYSLPQVWAVCQEFLGA